MALEKPNWKLYFHDLFTFKKVLKLRENSLYNAQ